MPRDDTFATDAWAPPLDGVDLPRTLVEILEDFQNVFLKEMFLRSLCFFEKVIILFPLFVDVHLLRFFFLFVCCMHLRFFFIFC